MLSICAGDSIRQTTKALKGGGSNQKDKWN